MNRNSDILIGIDAGTSIIKCAAFTASGDLIATKSRANQYDTHADGSVTQNMRATRDALVGTLADLSAALGSRAANVKAAALTAQGDGMWLVDKIGAPLHDGWLWLDSRSAGLVADLEETPALRTIFETTGTALNASQMRSQMLWLERHEPALLDEAASSYHPKDYLYACMTGKRSTDPSEALFTFGDFRTGAYASAVIEALGLARRADLLPDIVDGMTHADPLLDVVAKETGLPSGLPMTLGYIDVMCSAFGGGLYKGGADSAMTVAGTTGVHMLYTGSAEAVSLPPEPTGYTIAFPGGGFVQLQPNMAATLNIDWAIELARGVLATRGVEVAGAQMFEGLDERITGATPGCAIYHPYISAAGERGPFVNSDARAGFFGMDQRVGFYDLMRAIYEGLAYAARDCYESMGPVPPEIRLGGGAARSTALQSIMASVLNRPVRVTARPEAGAAGAAMMAAVKHGYYDNVGACTAEWVAPSIGPPVRPDPRLAEMYQSLFEAYVGLRKSVAPFWKQLADVRRKLAQ